MGEEYERKEDRTNHVGIIKFAYPSLNSRAYSMLYNVSGSLVSAFPSKQEMVDGILNSRLLGEFMALKKHSAVTVDLSSTGLGICTARPLKNGEELIVYNGKWHNKPMPAAVRWCKRHTDLFYRVGLEYLS